MSVEESWCNTKLVKEKERDRDQERPKDNQSLGFPSLGFPHIAFAFVLANFLVYVHVFVFIAYIGIMFLSTSI